ncbi:MAG: hypothetical protein HYY00_05490 [Chloroflexi bacterium]|nr:hypothetical protein [Chloroflexota bacterium]
MVQQPETKNLRLISHHDLAGFGNIGEGVALQRLSGGRRILWMAHESAPKEITAVDVTDPRRPRMVAQTELPHQEVRSNSLAAIDDVLLVAYQVARPGLTPAGMGVYDISNPEQPRQISFFDCSGPQSRGTHCIWWVDGHYAHLSTGMPDSRPTNSRDDQAYVIVDVSNPTRPTEVGRWWIPGTMEGDSEPPPTRHPKFDHGFSVHNVNVYPRRPDRAYCAFKDAGVVILDISEMAHPRLVSRLDYHPPLPGFTHTVVPLFDRGLLIVTEEATREGGEDWPKLVWVMDMRVETNPIMLATLPMPDTENFFARPGRFGAHNVHENQPLPTSFVSEELVFGTFFNAGLRVFNVTNPFRPEEVAYFVPKVPEGARANSVNDVYVDENRLLYAVDRLKGGLYILELAI